MSRPELQEHTFKELGISEKLLARIDALGFKHPTPIQHQTIPVATKGEDVMGIAQTGSGKTLAFAIPTLQNVASTGKTGLILLPTRELAVQVEETFHKIGGDAGLRTALVIGGTGQGFQLKQLRKNPHVIIATPGRLIDFVEQGVLQLNTVTTLVLDEADRMLDMGFAPQLNKILSFIPRERQTLLFSATMPPEITEIAQKYMKSPVRIEVARPGTTADKIEQEVFIVPNAEKTELLGNLLNEHTGAILVFSRTKHGAKNIARKIRNMGHTADEIHSNRTQGQRQRALKGFADGRYRILVATDIAARGIDVDNIELVVNYDLPDQVDDYVHRIGRTGRAGREGKAVSFACPDQKGEVAQIQKLINVTLPIKSPEGEELPTIERSTHISHKRKGSGGGGNRGGRGGRRGRNTRGGNFRSRSRNSGGGRNRRRRR